VPNYWFGSREIDLTRTQAYATDPYTGAVPLDPITGQPTITDRLTVDSYDNFINVFGRRVLYWPVFRTDLDNPQYYLENFSVGNDGIFGFQVRSRWNMNQVLRLTPPEGTKWTGALDYLSERGLALGSRVTYDRPSGFVFPGLTKGFYDSWFLLEDQGLDNLGLDRRNTPIEETRRGRFGGTTIALSTAIDCGASSAGSPIATSWNSSTNASGTRTRTKPPACDTSGCARTVCSRWEPTAI
jgi:hypothetical protein